MVIKSRSRKKSVAVPESAAKSEENLEACHPRGLGGRVR